MKRGMNMTSRKRLAAAGMLITLALAAYAGSGCGGTTSADPTPVKTFKITPAADATTAPGTTETAPAPTAPAATPDDPGGAEPIAIAGISSAFDVEEIEADAGTITIEFDNRDAGVIHNIHFFEGDDADGESIAETELEVGPIEQTLTFDAEPGEYFYQCDAHPTTMSGKLTVR